VLLLNECLLLLFISLSTQSGNFWIHPLKNCVTIITFQCFYASTQSIIELIFSISQCLSEESTHKTGTRQLISIKCRNFKLSRDRETHGIYTPAYCSYPLPTRYRLHSKQLRATSWAHSTRNTLTVINLKSPYPEDVDISFIS